MDRGAGEWVIPAPTVTMIAPRAVKEGLRKNLRLDIQRLVREMLIVEERWGHHGVFNAIRVWLNKPFRGTFRQPHA